MLIELVRLSRLYYNTLKYKIPQRQRDIPNRDRHMTKYKKLTPEAYLVQADTRHPINGQTI